jgi:DNA repair protein RadA/Sms
MSKPRPASVSQVRAAAHELTAFAKRRGIAVVMVGHVTKDGAIAGPRVVEHMVDCVLYFEGERGHQFRILRAVKNRFGPADEIGVFEMTGKGLAEVRNPSALFLAERGTARARIGGFCGHRGHAPPSCARFQALVSPSAARAGAPQRRGLGRRAAGHDPGRAGIALRLSFAGLDVYLNVAGGLRIGEPAADLAVAVRSFRRARTWPCARSCVIFGEISLSGALRPVRRKRKTG